MKYIIKNPTEEQIKSLKKLGLCVFYSESEGIHFIEVPEITEEELPKVDVVDLGLPSGLKWASCNIGASMPCESGKLFQFGRVDGYEYDDSNHKFYVGEDIPTTTSGTVYNEGDVLGTADDAAYVATNGKLRMPTAEEIDELLANTTNQWCQCNSVLGDEHTNHSVFGMLFISKKDESKKIFIPAAGYFDGSNDLFDWGGLFGMLWSSSVDSDDASYAYDLDFGSGYCDKSTNNRNNGCSVRGVFSIPKISEEELPEGVVDLGLPSGLKWASCNIGANKPCEYGKLFQWGRTDGYYYTDSNHKFYVGDGIPTTTSGKTYSIGEVLDKKDDAACAATNDKLRMPTYEEIDELLSCTENTWCQCTVLGDEHTNHSVFGRLFTSVEDESKKIFIPAAGQFSGVGNSFDYIGSNCILLSSSVYSFDANKSYNISFDSIFCDYSDNLHSMAGSVRGVCK